jgi:hypothetical protein
LPSQRLNLDGLPDFMREFFEQARAGTLPPLPVLEASAFEQLGFKSYADYLESALWKKIRRRVLERDQYKCRRCTGRANCVHHLAYSVQVLNGEADHLLVSMCHGCHTFVEVDDQGKPRSEQETERLLDQHDPDAFPAPVLTKVGPRKKKVLPPPAWDRMSSVQKLNWIKVAVKLGKPVELRR